MRIKTTHNSYTSRSRKDVKIALYLGKPNHKNIVRQ
jgi:hypothetical protein